MNAIWLIARRDFNAYMHGYLGFIIIAAILLIDGLMFYAFAMTHVARLSHDVLHDFFYIASGTTMVAGVMLTMRTFAEERTNGTDLLLHTAPINEGQIVIGKFIASMGMLTLLTLLSAYMPLMVAWNGKVSYSHIVVGYTGLLGLGAAVTAVGMMGSSLVRSQVAAGLLSAVAVVGLLITWELTDLVDPPLTDVVANMSLFQKHFEPFQAGQLISNGLVYYGSVTALFLWLTTKIIEGRRWT